MPSQSRTDWHSAYTRLLADVREFYEIVYGQLTDPERDMDPDARIAAAVNEVVWADRRLQARELFDTRFPVEAVLGEPRTDVKGDPFEGDVLP
jgi:hypothetical protein